MTNETRTKQGALEVLLGLRQSVVGTMNDEMARILLTDGLIEDVFREAWRSQFDDERGDFRAKLREIVSDAIEAQKLGRQG
jgi:hypothetical protein